LRCDQGTLSISINEKQVWSEPAPVARMILGIRGSRKEIGGEPLQVELIETP
jgi:hypothetical protein